MRTNSLFPVVLVLLSMSTFAASTVTNIVTGVQRINLRGEQKMVVSNRATTQVDTSGANSVNNAAGQWAESSNVIDLKDDEGTLDLFFATGPKPDQMTIYYPPRGQAGSKQITDTGMLQTPNNGKDLAQGFHLQIDFGPGPSTQIEIVVNEGATDARGTIWSYAGTGKAANGNTVTIDGSMDGIESPKAAAVSRAYERINLRRP